MIKTQLGRTVRAGAVAAGIVLLSAGTAAADPITTGNNGVGNGNQVVAPVQAPVNICGNAIAVAGVAGAGCQGGAVAQPEGDDTVQATTTGNNGVGNGNQVVAPVQAPVNICGNVIAVAGVAGAGCQGGADAQLENAGSPAADADAEDDAEAAPTDSDVAQQPDGLAAPVEQVTDTLGATHIVDTVTKGGPITTQDNPEYGQQPLENGAPVVSHDNAGVLSGNQIHAPVQAPVDVSGNAIAVAGIAGAGSQGGSAAQH